MHWIGLKTLILRECGVIFRFWSITLAPPVITTILYFTLFGEIIGKRIGTVDGVDYIQFLAPGLVLQRYPTGRSSFRSRIHCFTW
jgi:ABC-2 type transport system permease protein